MNYLKENWIYIIAPIAMILGGVAWFVFFSEPPENNAAHQYNLFDE